MNEDIAPPRTLGEQDLARLEGSKYRPRKFKIVGHWELLVGIIITRIICGIGFLGIILSVFALLKGKPEAIETLFHSIFLILLCCIVLPVLLYIRNGLEWRQKMLSK